MFNGEAFGKEMVGIVRGFVEKTVAPILSRLDALEAREPQPGKDGKDGRDGIDGKSIDPADLAALVRAEVERAIAALPKPQDGKSVTVEDVAPMVRENVAAVVAEAIKSIPAPKDGRDGRDGLDAVTPLLKDDILLFTMSDGSIKEVGPVVGADGKDGRDGADGVDGLGFDDMCAEYDGERGIVLRFVRGEQVKEFAFTMPVVIDRGVWVEGKGYSAGDAVTWAGSVWIAQKETNDKPDGGNGWRLSVKRGRDGKDGVVRDLTPKPVKVS